MGKGMQRKKGEGIGCVSAFVRACVSVCVYEIDPDGQTETERSHCDLFSRSKTLHLFALNH